MTDYRCAETDTLRAFQIAPKVSGNVWLKIAIGVMLIMMPMSFGVKLLLGISGVTWVNPVLIVSVIVAFYLRPVISPINTLLVVLFTLISAMAAGLIFEPLSPYSIVREPIKLVLAMIWFLVAKVCWEAEGEFVEKWLSITAVLQLLFAIYLWLVLGGYVPSAFIHAEFLVDYQFRQVVAFGDVGVQRLLGTFFEGPAFGLYMFCLFMVLSMRAMYESQSSNWRRVGITASMLGVLGSFSDQVYLGFLLFVMGISLVWFTKRAALPGVVVVFMGLVLAASFNLFDRLSVKINQIGEVVGADSLGLSGAGRAFHAQNGLSILSENPIVWITGVGPGRYGEYIAKAGMGPPSTTMQVTPLEWLLENGLIGFALIMFWLVTIGRNAWHVFGWMGAIGLVSLLIANAFQATWKWEAWFFALAFLAAQVPRQRNPSCANPQST